MCPHETFRALSFCVHCAASFGRLIPFISVAPARLPAPHQSGQAQTFKLVLYAYKPRMKLITIGFGRQSNVDSYNNHVNNNNNNA